MPISLSVRAAAGESSLSERTIHAAIKDGKLRAFRVGRRVLVTPQALSEYLSGKTAQPPEVSDESAAVGDKG